MTRREQPDMQLIPLGTFMYIRNEGVTAGSSYYVKGRMAYSVTALRNGVIAYVGQAPNVTTEAWLEAWNLHRLSKCDAPVIGDWLSSESDGPEPDLDTFNNTKKSTIVAN